MVLPPVIPMRRKGRSLPWDSVIELFCPPFGLISRGKGIEYVIRLPEV